jgi:hypothetical protein
MLPIDQGGGGGYEGEGLPYYGGPLAGERSRGALQADLANAAGFFMNPLGMMANYVLTGQTPAMQFGIGNQREAFGLGPSDAMPQGLMPQGGMSGMFGGLRDFLFGPQQQSVSLGDMRAPAGAPNPEMNVAVFNDAYQLAMSSGADDLAATNAASTAASLVAQGVDPITAVTIASQYALGEAGPQMPGGAPAAQGAPAQFAPQGLSPAVMAQMASGAADMYGNPISADAVAVNPIGGGGQIGVNPDFVGQSLAADNYGVMGFSGGGQSPSEFSFDDASSGAYGYF